VADVLLNRGECESDCRSWILLVSDRRLRELRQGSGFLQLLLHDLVIARCDALPRSAGREGDVRDVRLVAGEVPLEIFECWDSIRRERDGLFIRCFLRDGLDMR